MTPQSRHSASWNAFSYPRALAHLDDDGQRDVTAVLCELVRRIINLLHFEFELHAAVRMRRQIMCAFAGWCKPCCCMGRTSELRARLPPLQLADTIARTRHDGHVMAQQRFACIAWAMTSKVT